MNLRCVHIGKRQEPDLIRRLAGLRWMSQLIDRAGFSSATWVGGPRLFIHDHGYKIIYVTWIYSIWGCMWVSKYIWFMSLMMRMYIYASQITYSYIYCLDHFKSSESLKSYLSGHVGVHSLADFRSSPTELPVPTEMQSPTSAQAMAWDLSDLVMMPIWLVHLLA